jgi:hypothetical protein
MFSDLLGSIALSAGMDMAGAFAKASAQASSGAGALWCRFGSTAAKRAGRGTSATAKTPKNSLRLPKSKLGASAPDVQYGLLLPPMCPPLFGRIDVKSEFD